MQLGLRYVNWVQFAGIADTSLCGVCHCEGDPWLHWASRHVDLRCHILPLCLEKTGALIPFLFRAITLQRCRIVVRGIWGQYQYYCMFCLVTYIVGSNLKSKNQEVSGFSDQWVVNAIADFNEIWHKCLPTLLFETPKVSRNLKKSKFENFHIWKKSAITFAQGCISLCLLIKKISIRITNPLYYYGHYIAMGVVIDRHTPINCHVSIFVE